MPWATKRPKKSPSSVVSCPGKCERSRSHSRPSSPGAKVTGKSSGGVMAEPGAGMIVSRLTGAPVAF